MSKILIIDDNASVREFMTAALIRLGHEVIQAENGADGVELAQSQLPHLIISDVNMSHGDGYAILALLKNDPATSAIPFVLMTGYANRAGHERSKQEGADDYLSKPFTVESLATVVAGQLKTSGKN